MCSCPPTSIWRHCRCKSLLDELVDGIALILEGKLVGQPEKTALGEGLRCDFGSTGITYRPDRL